MQWEQVRGVQGPQRRDADTSLDGEGNVLIFVVTEEESVMERLEATLRRRLPVTPLENLDSVLMTEYVIFLMKVQPHTREEYEMAFTAFWMLAIDLMHEISQNRRRLS